MSREGLAQFPHAVLKWTLCFFRRLRLKPKKPIFFVAAVTYRPRISRVSFIHRPKPFPLLSALSNKHLSCGCVLLSSLDTRKVQLCVAGEFPAAALCGICLEYEPFPGKEDTLCIVTGAIVELHRGGKESKGLCWSSVSEGVFALLFKSESRISFHKPLVK